MYRWASTATSAAPVSQLPPKFTPSELVAAWAAPWVVNRKPSPWWKPAMPSAMATPNVPAVST